MRFMGQIRGEISELNAKGFYLLLYSKTVSTLLLSLLEFYLGHK